MTTTSRDPPVFIYFFYLLFDCLKTNRPLLRGQPHSPDVNHWVSQVSTDVHREIHIHQCSTRFPEPNGV